MIFWLCHLVCLWHSKYSYEQLHVDMALQPAGGEACSISSSSCWNGHEVFLNEGSGEPVIRLCSWQHGDTLGEIRCIWRPVKNTTNGTQWFTAKSQRDTEYSSASHLSSPLFSLICLRQRQGFNNHTQLGMCIGYYTWRVKMLTDTCCPENRELVQAAAPKVQPYILGKLLWSFSVSVDS